MPIASASWRQTVVDGARQWGLHLSADQVQVMQTHASEMIHWNRTTNLTAITEPRDVAVKHYVDALAAAAWLGDATRILDAGTGAGFPGLPLKIVRPDLSMVLVDSVRKKVSFLKHVIRTLRLNDIEAVHERLEDLGGLPQFQRRFDMVLCRAFSSIEDFARLALPFIRPGGRLLAMKGPQATLSKLVVDQSGHGTMRCGGAVFAVRIHRYRLPIVDARRLLVMMKHLPSGDG
ncbi:MAG: 16S rRNA (guanine(527)-N(7))-methyltransferase RsmG [Desulfosarcina sp.]